MTSSLIGLKEWSAVIAALGSGDQTLVVRGYEPKVQHFFLYPTFSFFNAYDLQKELFTQRFQKAHVENAVAAGRATTERGKKQLLVDIEYLAKVDSFFWITDSKIWEKLSQYYIWTPEHVTAYALGTKTTFACLWLLRVYKLGQPVVIGRTGVGGPPDYYRTPVEINISNVTAVLSDSDFARRKHNIEDIISQQS